MSYSPGALMLCVLCLSGAATAAPLQMDLLYIGSADQIRTGQWNPDNFLQVPSRQDELALVIEGSESWSEFSPGLSVHGRARVARQQSSLQRSEQEVKLQELSLDYAIRSDWLISLGKTQLHWDNSSSSQPLGFFQQQLEVSDLTDNKSLSSGIPLVALTHLRPSGSSATLVYGAQSNNQQVPEQWAFKWGWELGSWSPSLFIQKPAGQSAGWGAHVNWAMSDYLILYSSVFTRQGTRLLRHQQLGSVTPEPGWENPMQPFRIDEQRQYSRGVLGMNMNMDAWSAVFELSYDERKLTRSDWMELNGLVDWHYDVFRQGTELSQLALLNLAYDNQNLSSTGARQSYLYLYISREFEQHNLRFFAKTDPEFASSLTGFSVSAQVSESLELSGTLLWFSGGSDQEFSVLPISRSLELVVKYAF